MMIKGHGGNIHEMAAKMGCHVSEIIDMSSNLNPLGPPPGLEDYIKNSITAITALPQADASEVVSCFSDFYNIDYNRILAGNGTTQFIYTIPRALESKNALIVAPTYADYADACMMNKTQYSYYFLNQELNFILDIQDLEKNIQPFDTVFICNPNNPTGAFINKEDIIKLCAKYPLKYFIIDESYLPFVENEDRNSVADADLDNVIVLNSMSKMFKIPGLRIGFLIGSHKIIKQFETYSLPWSVNAIAQEAVIFLLKQKDKIKEFILGTRQFIKTEKKFILNSLKIAKGIKVFDTSTCFFLVQLYHLSAIELCAYMANHKILIRNCSNFQGLSDNFIRFSLKTKESNQKLIKLLLDNTSII